jgi:hypothetical protein
MLRNLHEIHGEQDLGLYEQTKVGRDTNFHGYDDSFSWLRQRRVITMLQSFHNHDAGVSW